MQGGPLTGNSFGLQRSPWYGTKPKNNKPLTNPGGYYKAQPTNNFMTGGKYDSQFEGFMHSNPHAQMAKKMQSLGRMPTEYRRGQGEQLYRQRFPQGQIAGSDKNAAVAGTGKPRVLNNPVGSATNPTMLSGYYGIANHESEHAYNQTPRMKNREVPTGMGDAMFAAEEYRRTHGEPLDMDLNFPGGMPQDLEWMRQQAEQHGYFDGGSMTDLLKTREGRQYLESLGFAGNSAIGNMGRGDVPAPGYRDPGLAALPEDAAPPSVAPAPMPEFGTPPPPGMAIPERGGIPPGGVRPAPMPELDSSGRPVPQDTPIARRTDRGGEVNPAQYYGEPSGAISSPEMTPAQRRLAEASQAAPGGSMPASEFYPQAARDLDARILAEMEEQQPPARRPVGDLTAPEAAVAANNAIPQQPPEIDPRQSKYYGQQLARNPLNTRPAEQPPTAVSQPQPPAPQQMAPQQAETQPVRQAGDLSGLESVVAAGEARRQAEAMELIPERSRAELARRQAMTPEQRAEEDAANPETVAEREAMREANNQRRLREEGPSVDQYYGRMNQDADRMAARTDRAEQVMAGAEGTGFVPSGGSDVGDRNVVVGGPYGRRDAEFFRGSADALKAENAAIQERGVQQMDNFREATAKYNNRLGELGIEDDGKGFKGRQQQAKNEMADATTKFQVYKRRGGTLNTRDFFRDMFRRGQLSDDVQAIIKSNYGDDIFNKGFVDNLPPEEQVDAQRAAGANINPTQDRLASRREAGQKILERRDAQAQAQAQAQQQAAMMNALYRMDPQAQAAFFESQGRGNMAMMDAYQRGLDRQNQYNIAGMELQSQNATRQFEAEQRGVDYINQMAAQLQMEMPRPQFEAAMSEIVRNYSGPLPDDVRARYSDEAISRSAQIYEETPQDAQPKDAIRKVREKMPDSTPEEVSREFERLYPERRVESKEEALSALEDFYKERLAAAESSAELDTGGRKSDRWDRGAIGFEKENEDYMNYLLGIAGEDTRKAMEKKYPKPELYKRDSKAAEKGMKKALDPISRYNPRAGFYGQPAERRSSPVPPGVKY